MQDFLNQKFDRNDPISCLPLILRAVSVTSTETLMLLYTHLEYMDTNIVFKGMLINSNGFISKFGYLCCVGSFDSNNKFTVTNVKYQPNNTYNDHVSSFSGMFVTTKDVLKLNNTTSFTPTSDYHPSTKKYVDDSISAIDLSGKQDTIQYSTMPTADATTVGKIVQYTGTTDSTYTNGYFYTCVSDGETEPTYSWEQLNVQPSSGSSEYKIYELPAQNDITLNADGTLTAFTTNLQTWIASVLQECYDSGIEPIFLAKTSSSAAQYKQISCFGYLTKKLSSKPTGSMYIDFGTILTGASGYSYPTAGYYMGVLTHLMINLHLGWSDSTLRLVYSPSFAVSGLNLISTTNETAYTPTGDYNPSTKLYTDKTHYENMAGYDATKTQVLKNINGTLTWVDE